MYEIFYEKRVFKDLDKIPNLDVKRIMEVVDGLRGNPLPLGTKKLAGRAALYRIRKGDYRIVYSINHALRQVQITLIRHRKDVYRELQ